MEMMTLSKEDGALFYELWRPLLQFANKKQKFHPRINFEKDRQIDAEKANEVSSWIWRNTDIIDEYLAKKPDLPSEHREIVSSWKRCISGMWFIERHLKSGSVFLGKSPYAFLVKGITTPYEEMLGMYGTPICIQGTLLPFRNCIITDGLIAYLPISIGPNMRKSMKEEYLEAKKNHHVITSLTDDIYQLVMRKGVPKKKEEYPNIVPFPSASDPKEDPIPESPEEDDDDDLFSDEMPEENRRYLRYFEEDLQRSNLSTRTIDRHMMNADLYLNDFLCYHEEEKMEDGPGSINFFMMTFFIEKCMWASASSIRQTAASIKKFYKSMLVRNLISQSDYDELTDTIKSHMNEWLEELRRFDEDCEDDDWF